MTGTGEFAALRIVSAKLGADPLLVQAAGGNTSFKSDGVMWIKASGTWLRDAEAKDVFVPLDLGALTSALERGDPECESCAAFVRQDLNQTGLRPSIETSVHGLLRQRVVLHVHCVNTIAWMILADAHAQVAPRMSGINWAFVPYARPGLQLSHAIRQVVQPDTSVLLLQNHGLVVAGETVAGAEDLLRHVIDRLRRTAVRPAEAIISALRENVPLGYRIPEEMNVHGFAMMDWAVPLVCDHVYYPDHAVFLGANMPRALSQSSPVIVVPGRGVFVKEDAKPAVDAMLGCLTDVFARLSSSEELKSLTAHEVDALLNWDAEKYRQSLKQA